MAQVTLSVIALRFGCQEIEKKKMLKIAEDGYPYISTHIVHLELALEMENTKQAE